MNAGANGNAGSRTNRRRQSPARVLGAALGRLLGSQAGSHRTWSPSSNPGVAGGLHRLALA